MNGRMGVNATAPGHCCHLEAKYTFVLFYFEANNIYINSEYCGNKRNIMKNCISHTLSLNMLSQTSLTKLKNKHKWVLKVE